MRTDIALVIFVKNPELGKVKTRIAKDVGDAHALDIYKQLLAYTRALTIDIPCVKYLYYFPYLVESDDWSTDDYTKRLQKGDSLGAKMKNAFAEVLQKHKKVVLIGSDCLGITDDDIARAFVELDENDVVLGPADDGGYYLIGMNAPQFFLLEDDMPWSSETLLKETIYKIQDRGLDYALLNTRRDIDYIEDWEEERFRLDELKDNE